MRIVLKGGKVIDGVDGKARDSTAIVIEDGKLAALDADPGTAPDTIVVDTHGKTIMPGVIDTHVHFAHMYTGYMTYHSDVRWGFIAGKTIWAMERMLRSGVTTGRDLGGLDAGFVDAEEAGVITAPRLVGNAVQFMMPTNGSTDQLPGVGGTTSALGQSLYPGGLPDPHCDGPWQCRKKAREVLLAGADILKIGTGGCLARRDYDHTRPTFTREEIDVFVDEARRQGIKLHSHVIGGPGLEDAVAAGVDCIEHGSCLDDRLIDMMAERGTWWVPTFWILDYHIRVDPTEEARDDMKRFRDQAAMNLEKANRAGVPIAMGSDGGAHDADNVASMRELELMADAGMSTADVIVAATRRAAELIGIDEKVGTLQAGKEADLIVVNGDPLTDIGLLQREDQIELVLKAGQPVGGNWTKLDLESVIRQEA
jgi:imidazolonepropionase-like amidohydrolase